MKSGVVMTNAFLALRAKRLAEATREFRARGASVVRCDDCQLAHYACICVYRPRLQSRCEVVLLMHRNEVFKPTNTGRLIADVLPAQTHVFCWHRTEPDPALRALLADPERQCCVVYPEEGGRQMDADALLQTDCINTFILLDGTWKQGRRMLTLSRWLDAVPRMALPETLLRGYAVRKSRLSHQLSTAEAGALCLQLAGEAQQAEALLDYFALFNQHYLATRGCYQPEITELHAKLLSRASH
jgi:DTW domain-containing protein